MINNTETYFDNQVENRLPPDLLYAIVGPTASGKTQLGVRLAERISGEIISIDSRQVYRGMDIGTGKDIREYGDTPYHLIDIRNPQERYDISQFQQDFQLAYEDIRSRQKHVIAVGGTNSYLYSLLIPQPYIQAPINIALRDSLRPMDKEELSTYIKRYNIPTDFRIDFSSHKRLMRAIEILEALANGFQVNKQPTRLYKGVLFGINPPLTTRRENISRRLRERIKEGLIEEVEQLLRQGLSHEDLQYFGLEYKYVSLYISGKMDSDTFYTTLGTEIHRYAKRQMTFLRKMEKDGVEINWLKSNSTTERLAEIRTILANKKG